MATPMLLPVIKVDDLPLIGEGAQGRVYQIDAERCIKTYKKSKYFHRELDVLRQAQSECRFPKLYGWSKGQIIREYIPGTPLAEYLQNHPLTDSIAAQLLELYYSFERLGFRRLDIRLEHIILTPEGDLRVIDPTNANTMREKHPRRMLQGLEHLGYKEAFLKYVEEYDPKLYRRWVH